MSSAIRMNLSGSVDGKPIKIAANSSPGTLIHTATSSSTPGAGGVWDEVWIWCYNSSVVTTSGLPLIRLQFGGTTDPDNKVEQPILMGAGNWILCNGLIIQNSLVIRAYAASPNTYIVSGYVNRITN